MHSQQFCILAHRFVFVFLYDNVLGLGMPFCAWKRETVFKTLLYVILF